MKDAKGAQQTAAGRHRAARANTLITRSAFPPKINGKIHQLKRQPLQNHIHRCAYVTMGLTFRALALAPVSLVFYNHRGVALFSYEMAGSRSGPGFGSFLSLWTSLHIVDSYFSLFF